MIVDNLKVSILETAIRGKLVSNNSNNELIDSELEKFYKKYNGKNETINSTDFTIPSSWRWVKLDNITYSNIGLTYKPVDVTNDSGTIVLRSNNIKDGKLFEDDFVRVNIEVPDTKKCHSGDILMCSRNGSKRLVGKCAIIDKEGYSFGAFMAIIRSDIPKYLYYLFNSNYFRKKMLGDASTTTINQITQKMLAEFWIPLPPIEEQQRIVSKIEELFVKLDEIKPIEIALSNLKQEFSTNIKKSILSYAVTGHLIKQNPNEEKVSISDVLDDADLPENWIRVKAKTILNIVTGKKDANYGTKDGEYLFYTCANIPIKSPTYSFEGKNLILPGNGANVGLTIYSEDKFEAYQRTYVVNSKYSENEILLKYIYYYFNAYWSDYNKDKMFGSAIPYIKLGNLENFEINVPPIEEQKRIVDKIEQLLPLCNDIENLINNID